MGYIRNCRRAKCIILFFAEFIFLMLLYNWLSNKFDVVLYSDAYYLADYRQLELINNGEHIVCDTLTISKDGYILNLEAKEIERLKSFEIFWPITEKDVHVYGVGIRWLQIPIVRIDFDNNFLAKSDIDNISKYMVLQHDGRRIGNVYRGCRLILLKLIVISFALLLILQLRKLHLMERMWLTFIEKIHQNRAVVNLLYIWSALFPFAVGLLGIYFEYRGIDLRNYLKEKTGMAVIIALAVSFLLWLIIEKYLEHMKKDEPIF